MATDRERAQEAVNHISKALGHLEKMVEKHDAPVPVREAVKALHKRLEIGGELLKEHFADDGGVVIRATGEGK